jgi:hypothetical protein
MSSRTDAPAAVAAILDASLEDGALNLAVRVSAM